MAYTVRILQLPSEFSVHEDETIVEAALNQNIEFPFSCASGTCGTCKCHLTRGSVSLLDNYSRFTLTDEERKRGLILACCAIPHSDCELVLNTATLQTEILECRVASIRKATHDIKIINIERPNSGFPLFSAGQYADLSFSNLPYRSYSMANRPGDPILEFHVRLSPEGRVSSFVHQQLAPGDAVRFKGPLGTAHLREQDRRPIIALAGGSGLGPIKSIIETALFLKMRQPIHCYFGARDERDLYYIDHFLALRDSFPNFSFIPVLSEASGQTRRRTGFLAAAIKVDFNDLRGFKAYLAGPPIMVDTATQVLLDRGVLHQDIHADSF